MSISILRRILAIFSILTNIREYNSIPNLLNCNTPLTVGSRIMFGVQASTQRNAIVQRGSTQQISNGESYIPKETLSLSLSDTSGQFIFQVSTGSFFNGICRNLRIIPKSNSPVLVNMPDSGIVNITVAWANSYSFVKINVFTLYPSPNPTTATTAPMVITVPTPLPTSSATIISTSIPTSLVPSLTPSSISTSAPVPTEIPTSISTSAPVSTEIPISIPTIAPTFTAVANFSIPPSSVPSLVPSSLPTIAPTPIRRTISPSSSIPTSVPSLVLPSSIPTSAPTAIPTSSVPLILIHSSMPASAPSTITTAVPISAVPSLVSASIPTIAPTPTGRKPSAIPSRAPSRMPTSIPTNAPVKGNTPTIVGNPLSNSPTPSSIPTSAPTFTGLPTTVPTVPSTILAMTPLIRNPTSNLTANPSAPPSLVPTNGSIPPTVPPSNIFIPFDAAERLSLSGYSNGLSLDLAVGLFVGAIGALAVFASIAFYLRSLRSGDIAWISFLVRLPVSSVSALLLSCAAVGLVSAWAQNGHTDSETGFLGSPNWKSNTLAWHVLLMVGGFFCAQVVAVCCWSAIPPPSHPTPCSLPKAMHVLLQVAAMSAMVAGLYAIVQHMVSSKAPSLTTMHSWVGVASIAVYGVAMLWGAGSASLAAWYPRSFLREAFDLRLLHKMIGLTSIALSAAAVVTGVNYQLGQGACYYNRANFAEKDYASLPQACRIANGLGLCALLATVSVFIAVGLRNYSPDLLSKAPAVVEKNNTKIAKARFASGSEVASDSSQIYY